MKISRCWAMPNKSTFTIKPIHSLISELFLYHGLVKKIKAIDPFSNNSPFNDKCISNDIDPEIIADYHLDALEFLKIFNDSSVDIVLFDPPYSPRQVSECYKRLKKNSEHADNSSKFLGEIKN